MLACCFLHERAHRGQRRRVGGEEEDALAPTSEGFVRKLRAVFALRFALSTPARQVAQARIDTADLLAQLARNCCGVRERLVRFGRGKEVGKVGVDVGEELFVRLGTELCLLYTSDAADDTR